MAECILILDELPEIQAKVGRAVPVLGEVVGVERFGTPGGGNVEVIFTDTTRVYYAEETGRFLAVIPGERFWPRGVHVERGFID